MNCGMMQRVQPNQGTAVSCPVMQGMRPGMMRCQMQPGSAPGAAPEAAKPN
jgi:hypothetical protein